MKVCRAPGWSKQFLQTAALKNWDRDVEIKQTPKSGTCFGNVLI